MSTHTQIVGFETGSLVACRITGGTAAAQATYTAGSHSAYALRCNPTTTGTAYVSIGGVATGNGGAQSQTGVGGAPTYYGFHFLARGRPAANDEAAFGVILTLDFRVTSAGTIAAYDVDSGSTLLGTGTTVLDTATWYWVTLKIDTTTPSPFSWELRINGTTELSGTCGDVSGLADSGWYLGKWTNYNGQSVDFVYDDFVVDSAGWPVETFVRGRLANADGASTAWTIGAGSGSRYQVVDETPFNDDTDYLLSTGVTNDADLVGFEDTGALFPGQILSVKPHLWLKRDGATNGNVRLRHVSGATTTTLSANFTTTSSYALCAAVLPTDPNTSALWKNGDVDAFQAGAVEQSANKSRLSAVFLEVAYTPNASRPVSQFTQPVVGWSQRRYGSFARGGTSYTLTAGAGSYGLTGTAAVLDWGHKVTAAAGSYSLTGQAMTPVHGHPMTAGAGSYSLTGTPAVLDWGHKVAAGIGSYTLTAADAGLRHAYPLVAGVGAYSLSGTDAALRSAHTVTAGAGAYTLTGTAAGLKRGYPLTAVAGSYTLTGQAMTPRLNHSVTAGAGSYTLTGTAAALRAAHTIVGGSGAYALSGTAAGLKRGYPLAAGAGSYTLTGQAAALVHGYPMAAAAGSYSLSGTAAALRATHTVPAGVGSYTLTGTAAGLTYSGAGSKTIVADPGSYSLSGQTAVLAWGHHVVPAAGSYALTGAAAGVRKGSVVPAGAGSYALTGTAAGVRVGRVVPGGVGSYSLQGQAATPRAARVVVPGPGSYSLQGQAAGIGRNLSVTGGSGTYAQTGQAAGFLLGKTITLTSGVYTLTGAVVTFTYTTLSVALPGGVFYRVGETGRVFFRETGVDRVFYRGPRVDRVFYRERAT